MAMFRKYEKCTVLDEGFVLVDYLNFVKEKFVISGCSGIVDGFYSHEVIRASVFILSCM